MVEINDEELERRLSAIRLKTSPGLDARVMELGMQPVPRTGRHLSTRVARLAAATVAVCMVVVLAWWLLSRSEVMPSAYAELMEAVENSKAAEWVHIRMDVDGQQVEGWVSFKPTRTFTKEGERVEVVDYQAGRSWKYDPEARTITIIEMANEEDPFAGVGSYLDFMLAEFEQAKHEEGLSLVKGEEIIEGKKYIIFTVRVEAEGVSAQGRVIIDPELNRVARMERFVESEGMTKPQVIEYEYPKTGPADIYALGVPRDARIVNMIPSQKLIDLIRGSIETARDRFAPTYYAIVYKGHIDRDGKYNPMEVDVVHKKNGRWRVERIVPFNKGELIIWEDLRRNIPHDDMTVLEAWCKTRPLWEVYFFNTLDQADAKNRGTGVRLDNDGLLRKEPSSAGAIFTPERYSWARRLPPNATVLPETHGDSGPLAFVERTTQGRILGGELCWPSRHRQYFNPSHHYVRERSELVWDANGAWQEDKDKKWLAEVDLELLKQRHHLDASDLRDYRSTRTERVLEYGQTLQGQWYARKVLLEQQSNAAAISPSREIWIIHLDTERDIPDELFDPGSVTAEMFRAEKAQPGSE